MLELEWQNLSSFGQVGNRSKGGQGHSDSVLDMTAFVGEKDDADIQGRA
jgi:hypothetical protein